MQANVCEFESERTGYRGILAKYDNERPDPFFHSNSKSPNSTRDFKLHDFKHQKRSQVFNYQKFLSQLNNPANTCVVQLKVLSQTRHGVVATSKGRLNRGVAIAGVLFHVVFKCQRHGPALGVRNFQAGSADTRALGGLLGHSAHFVDEFLVTQVHLPT